MNLTARKDLKRSAFRFVLIFGIVNLFADMTYEGCAVPALALAGNWPMAAIFLIAERTGRAIRKPSVETVISHAGKSVGQGWVFGLNEALDQTGATVGPLITALVLYLGGPYHRAFAFLLIPALLCLSVLALTRFLYPRPHGLEERQPQLLRTGSFPDAYWVYLAAGGCLAAGFADFSLIAFHFHRLGTVAQDLVQVFYANAMAVGALASLILGRLLDQTGLGIVLAAIALSAFSAPLVFWGGLGAALVGVILWGIGLGAQDSALKALLADLVPAHRRGSAFGLFDTAFGIAWFIGSVAMGLLYGRSITALVVFSIALQFAALPLLWLARRR